MKAMRDLIFAARLALGILALLTLPALAQGQTWPRSITHEGGTLELPAQPQSVVSTAPSLTGILLGIDAPIVASAATSRSALTDGKGFFSQWAAAADSKDVAVLYPNLTFDIEAVIMADPDLVIGSTTGADNLLQYLPELEAQGIPVMLLNYSNTSWEDLARQLGRATGHEAGAEAAIARFDSEISRLAAEMAPPAGKATIIGYNLSGTFSVGRVESPQAQVISALGFEVEPLPEALRGAVSRSSDFDFISHENLAAAIKGETVFLLSGTDATAKAFLTDPVLANLPAVKARRVYPLGLSSFRMDYFSGLEMARAIAQFFPR